MPNFNLSPVTDDDLEPVWPTKPSRTPPPPRLDRAGRAREVERQAGNVPVIGGLLKPTYQLLNALGSPDTLAGAVVGPANAISQLGNAIGDLVQGKPFANGRGLSNPDWSQINVNDAWQITPQQTRQYNPIRLWEGQDVTPADEAGLQLGGVIGAEGLTAILTGGVVGGISKLPAGVRLLNSLKSTATVRRLAVAQRANPAVRTAVGLANNAGQALTSTAAAAVFMDADQGNTADAIKDVTGIRLPGTTDPKANYLQKLGNNVLVDGIATPLTLIGAGSAIRPLRRWMAGDGIGWMDDLAEVELEPYMGTRPPVGADRQLPATGQSTGAWRADQEAAYRPFTEGADPAVNPWGPEFDSAISRSQAEQTQIQQVQQQRQWLMDQGLVEQGEGGQLQLNMGTAVDPEARLMIRELQTQRGQLIKQMKDQPELAGEIEKQLAQLDQQINELKFSPQNGLQQEPDIEGATPKPLPELDDAPDPRPEIDTYLAHLDELDDSQLRDIHSRVWKESAGERNAAELTAAQQRVSELEARLADIEQRLTEGKIKPLGAKRMTSKVQKELAEAQLQVTAVQARSNTPEPLVGDQLRLALPPAGLPDSPDFQVLSRQLRQLPPIRSMERTASEFGYRTPDDYRSALQGWNRDQLRRLAMPDSSPEVAALVKARTGRRVWQAKKQDIIDALVELSERRGRYLPPEPPVVQQPDLKLTADQSRPEMASFPPSAGDIPADLSAPGMTRLVDADGNEVVAPASEYVRRGLDPETRQRFKKEILQRAIDNGEVQAPISPLPVRPQVETFNQGSMVDQLLSDPTGELSLLYATDQVPTYKAGGRNADALIEEMRLRFEYQRLDAAAAKAQRDALLAAHGWDKMTWEQKKASGLLDPGQYAYTKQQLSAAMEFAGDPKLPPLEWTPEGVKPIDAPKAPAPEPPVPEVAASPQVEAPAAAGQTRMTPKEQLAAAKKKAAKDARRAKEEAAAQKKVLELDEKRAKAQTERLRKERARLEKQISEGSCNG